MEHGTRFWSKVHRGDGCWTWKAGRNEHGYGNFFLNRRMLKAHRVAWELTNGPIPEGAYVLHSCDNPPCVNPAHLSIGDQAQNMRECWARGRHLPVSVTVEAGTVGPNGTYGGIGEDNGNAALTWDAVREIRARWRAGEAQTALAAQYGVTKSTIYLVVHEKSWIEKVSA